MKIVIELELDLYDSDDNDIDEDDDADERSVVVDDLEGMFLMNNSFTTDDSVLSYTVVSSKIKDITE